MCVFVHVYSNIMSRELIKTYFECVEWDYVALGVHRGRSVGLEWG